MKRRKRSRYTKYKYLILPGAICALSIYALWLIVYIFSCLSPLPQVDPRTSFTVVVLPDTQVYTEKYPDILCNQIEWIKANKNRLNIVFVSHMGDIVQHGNKKIEQWQSALGCISELDTIVPYSIIPGNHDSEIVSKRASGYTTYNTYFPALRYSSQSWYRGYFNNNQNSYQIISPLGQELLFMNLEPEAPDEVLAWAKGEIAKHPHALAIVNTHKYLYDNEKGRNKTLSFGPNGNSGENMWQELIRSSCNIGIVWSGHYHKADGEDRQVSQNDCGLRVDEIVQDYQDRERGGNGLLRIYIFTPKQAKIRAYTYSPVTNQFETDADSQFILPLTR